MLVELKIENFGIIDQLTIRPEEGFNALTGETGSGKSLILTAIEAVLGGRCGSGYVRNGSRRAILEAVFHIESQIERLRPALDQAGIQLADPYLTIRREVSLEGRPRPMINGTTVNLSVLRGLSMHLAEIHGQHEHQRILDADVHLEYLDQFAGTADQCQQVGELYHKYRNLSKRLKTVTLESDEREQRQDYLRFALDELEGFDVQKDEYDSLLQEQALIENSGRLYHDLYDCYQKIRGDGTSLEQSLEQIVSTLQNHVKILPGLEDTIKEVQESSYLIESAGDFLREQKDNLQFSPERLEDIQERIAGYQKLFKKYGGNTEAVLATMQDFLKEWSSIELTADELELLHSDLEITRTELLQQAEELSRKRRAVVHILEEKLAAELANLGMAGARIQIAIQREVQDNNSASSHNADEKRRAYVIYEKGLDRVEFMLLANTGERVLPLRKVASGGELSRITLALKTIFFDDHHTGTVIFDEIDTGVGGEVAHFIGRRLQNLSAHSQVLVVTHLHQLASQADGHFRIEKSVSEGRTRSSVSQLHGEERLQEMARMLGGGRTGRVVLEHARQLLESSKAS